MARGWLVVLSLFGPVALAPLAVSQVQSPAAGSAAVEARGRSGSLELTLQVPGIEFHQGESVTITLILRNVGSQPVELPDQSPALLDFLLFDAKGKKLSPWSAGRPQPMAPPRPMSLLPGESITRTLPWDLAISSAQGRQPLAAGDYAIQGVLLVRPRDPSDRLRLLPRPLMTEKLFFTVRPGSADAPEK